MRLLLDQNISHRIIPNLNDSFSEVRQVRELKLENIKDSIIWEYAKENNFSIVTFDADYFDLCNLKGFPPKIIWLRTGNTDTNKLAKVLIDNANNINNFITNANFGCLEIK